MIADELPRLFGVAGDGDGRQAMESNLVFASCNRVPLRPVDVLFDLGMSEEMVTSYLWRWQGGKAHNSTLSFPRAAQPSRPRAAEPASPIILL
jgi:hypothetical protein